MNAYGKVLVTYEYVQKELRNPLKDEDSIHRCGEGILSRLETDPDEVLKLAHSELHVFPFKDVPECWRRLYSEASLWKVCKTLKEFGQPISNYRQPMEKNLENELSKSIQVLDMSLIMTNALGRYELVHETIGRLSELLPGRNSETGARRENDTTPSKRRKLKSSPNLSRFKASSPSEYPIIKHPIVRVDSCSLPDFQAHLLSSHKYNDMKGPLPQIISHGVSEWPAISYKLWENPSYWLSRTSMGHRLVPVEIGRSYTDDGWAQKIMPFREFMEKYMLDDASESGYLAQHDLFLQIPRLKEDIFIPDFCFSEPPAPRVSEAVLNSQNQNDSSQTSESSGLNDSDQSYVALPLLNIWMGSAHTISPAHTDPHHNILAQVVGHKYVRLFAPSETPRMYPQSVANGIDMSNTSRVDVGEAIELFEGWANRKPKVEEPPMERDSIECDHDIDSLREVFTSEFPEFAKAAYVEGILGPGDCLYLPKGWWHYVRSLSPSISVSFWWD
jgi:cupin-like protein